MKKYILAGAGTLGRKALDFLGEEKVYAFYDGKKAGTVVRGKRVIGLEELRKIWQDYDVILSVRKHEAIREVTEALGHYHISCRPVDEVCDAVITEEAKKYDALNQRPNYAYDPARKWFFWSDRVSGAASVGTYFRQDLWAARRIFETRPKVHCDIASRVDGFIAHLVTFGQRVRMLDIRPLDFPIEGVEFQQCDATNLDGIPDNSIESLSALCSLEHFGLGRFGDPIDPEACFKCFHAIAKKLAPGGRAYISIPIGAEHVEFNAHRVFLPSTVVEEFQPLELVEFSSAYGKQPVERNIDIHKYDDWQEFGGGRCGLFEFVKKA